jgi:hypothetical protein
MPFTDFIKTTVQLSAGAATTLAAITVLSTRASDDPSAATFAFLWWAVAALIGYALGARSRPSKAVGELLASARTVSMLPEQRPGLIIVSRLWPLLVSTLVAGVLGVLASQIPAVAAGFAIIAALAWRNQYRAILAIERRDGVRFHVDRSSPWRTIKLTRTPGFKVFLPT